MAEMKHFNFRELLINIGRRIPAGCEGANWPDSCHVMTCLNNSKWCGIPSTVRTVPVGDELEVVFHKATSIDSLRADLKSALRELDELEKEAADPRARLAGLEALSAEIDAVKRDISKG